MSVANITGDSSIGTIKLTPAEEKRLRQLVQNAPKTDTTYTNNRLYKVIDKYFMVNPVYEDPILSQLGTLDVSDMSPNQKYVQYDAVVAKSNGVVSDDLVFSKGDSKNYPGIRKSKFFQYGVFLTDLQKMALDKGGAGGNLIAAKVASELQASKSFMTVNMLKWIVGYQSLTSEIDYDPEWVPCFNAQAATGTVSAPEDICSTAGTADAYAYNFTGTNKSKDFVLQTFGESQERFRAQRDSTTGEQMLKGALSANTFLHLLNPSNVMKMKQTHPYNGVQDDQNVTYFDQVMKLEGTHMMLGSYDIDAAASTAEDGTNIVGTILNPNENFKLGTQVPFQTSGWIPAWHGRQFGYYKRAFQKVIGWAKPWYISGSWKKAFHHWTYVYKNDA
jgi:hypothetical protein